MHIVVKASVQQKEAFLLKGVPADVRVSFLNDVDITPEADAYFDLLFEDDGFASAIICTASGLDRVLW